MEREGDIHRQAHINHTTITVESSRAKFGMAYAYRFACQT